MMPVPQIAIRPVGDSALIVEINQPRRDGRQIGDEVLRVASVLERAAIDGVMEITTAFTTVALFYDPMRIAAGAEPIFDALDRQVRGALSDASLDVSAKSSADRRVIEIPVCYDDEFAMDVAEVAAHASLAQAEVIGLHRSAEYRVAAVGFTPGFPYLSGLPPQLATPRRATPRTAVPAGSVAIGGSQAGIYAISSPGGWHVIGRTPVKLFDATSNTPAVLRAGDRVRFHQITAAEFHAAEAAQATGNK